MILLIFIDMYVLNEDSIFLYETSNDKINNNSICSIKKLIIIISMVSLIYLLLHQINIDSQSKLYNKILIIIMIIDIVISLFFLSDTFIKKM
jgi:hypothetical protein